MIMARFRCVLPEYYVLRLLDDLLEQRLLRRHLQQRPPVRRPRPRQPPPLRDSHGRRAQARSLVVDVLAVLPPQQLVQGMLQVVRVVALLNIFGRFSTTCTLKNN